MAKNPLAFLAEKRSLGKNHAGRDTEARCWPVPELSISEFVQRPGNLPCMGLPKGQNLSNLVPLGSRFCGTYISETAGQIYSIQKFCGIVETLVVPHHWPEICQI